MIAIRSRRSARRPGIGRRSGITLVELMLVGFLVLIVLFGAGSMYVGATRSFKLGTTKLKAQQEATLLSTVINRRVRVGSGIGIYVVPNRSTPADSGNGVAILDADGHVMQRLEWSSSLQTLVDSTGVRVTAMKLRNVFFKKIATAPKTLRYRYKTDDEKGDLVDIESSVTVRN
jgi:Tfp pilus assembly protein PilW